MLTASAPGCASTPTIVSWIRHRHRIPALVLKLPEERTVGQVAEKLGVSPGVVRDWIRHNVLSARRPDGTQYYITLNAEKEKELAQRAAKSVRLHPKRDESFNHAIGGAV